MRNYNDNTGGKGGSQTAGGRKGYCLAWSRVRRMVQNSVVVVVVLLDIHLVEEEVLDGSVVEVEELDGK